MASIRSTMQITRTMEMISTARIQRALARSEAAAPYKDAITNMLAKVAATGLDESQPLLTVHEEERHVLFILIASDRGLAGGFNILPQRAVEQEMAELAQSGVSSSVITCGRKPTEYFSYRNIEPVMSFTGMSAEPDRDQANCIASYVMDGYTSGKIDRVMLKYWHARNRVDQQQVSEQLLPIAKKKLMMPTNPRTHEAVAEVSYEASSEYEFEPSSKEVLGYLIPAYFKTVIFHALLDSAAAEHGARRCAMQSATDNAKEVLGTLSRTFNRERQANITTELNEIVGGASALEDDQQ